MFSGQRLYIHQGGCVSKQQIRLLTDALTKAGAVVVDRVEPEMAPLNYFVADGKFTVDDCARFVSVGLDSAPLSGGCRFVTIDWPVGCLKARRILPPDDAEGGVVGGSFELRRQRKRPPPAPPPPPSPPPDAEESATVAKQPRRHLDDEAETAASQLPARRVGAWICATSSSDASGVACPENAEIAGLLERMADTYGSTNDKWRVYSYRKAAHAVRRHPRPIESRECAQALPGVGTRLADKIWEIARSGRLEKLECLSSDETVTALKLFTGLWGAGPVTAQAWVSQGLRSLSDLAARPELLNRQQRIGLRHYDDFLDRMPRSEAAEIEAAVADGVRELGPGFLVQACGSYRRGRPDCGDVDILVTHPDGTSHSGLLSRLVALLSSRAFLTDHLVSCDEAAGPQKKYLGVCRLPGNERRFRRLDIIAVPYAEYACALVYFTGSEHFCRSLRHLAKRAGMSLNEHALSGGVLRRDGRKVNPGRPVDTPDEASVFRHLGVPYRPPEERDH